MDWGSEVLAVAIYMYINISTHTHAHERPHTYAHTHTPTQAHTYTCMHAYTRTRIHTRSRTHTHKHTFYMQALVPIYTRLSNYRTHLKCLGPIMRNNYVSRSTASYALTLEGSGCNVLPPGE